MARSVKINLIANFLGNSWRAIVNLAFVPFYIKYLGIESYGLIGIFATMQSLLVLLDMGLSTTLNREMARYLGGKNTIKTIHDLLRSMEIIYLIFALGIALLSIYLSDWMANHWLIIEHTPLDVATRALTIMGFVISLRWWGGLYRSAIMGLQAQVPINIINVICSTLRGVGVLGILAWVSPTIDAFFLFQGMVAILELIALRLLLYHLLPGSGDRICFSWNELHKVWRFAGGIMIITVLALLLTQSDKLLLSKMLSLSKFAYYSLAAAIAAALYMIIYPISSVALPRLAELVASNKHAIIVTTYHRFTQLITITVIPTAFVISFFSEHLILLWTRDVQTTYGVAPIVSVLVMGTMLNGLVNIPYLLQLAYGWTQFSIIVNTIAIIILIPSLYFASQAYGPVGAAWIWFLLNSCYVLIAIPFMHRRLLKNEMRAWYLRDILPGFIAVFIAVSVCRIFTPKPIITAPGISLLILIMAGTSSLLAACFATHIGRQILKITKDRLLDFYYKS